MLQDMPPIMMLHIFQELETIARGQKYLETQQLEREIKKMQILVSL